MARLEDFEKDVDNNLIAYNGDTSLRPLHCRLPLTLEHIKEIKRCKEDYLYFIENYYNILSLDGGMHLYSPRDYQKEIMETMHNNRFTIVMASRQAGKSTSFEAYCLWYTLFNPTKRVALLANKAENSVDLLRKIKEAYTMLPKWLQQGITTWNQSRIELENGSIIFTAATSSSGVRSKSISLLIIDECVEYNTIVTIKDKTTQEIFKIKIGDLYKKIQNESTEIPENIYLNKNMLGTITKEAALNLTNESCDILLV